MTPVTIVVLGKYADIFAGFRASVERFAPAVPKVLVRDGSQIPPPEDWTVVQGPPKFSMAGNANLGWRAAAADSDVLYCGDDVRFLQENTVEGLARLAHSQPTLGILSPRIVGGVNNHTQMNPESEIHWTEKLAFPCVYIKRALIDAIGYLDERFIEYGFDDDDFCQRAQASGYRLAVTNQVAVEHQSTSTFLRNHGGDKRPIVEQMQRNRELWHQIQRAR